LRLQQVGAEATTNSSRSGTGRLGSRIHCGRCGVGLGTLDCPIDGLPVAMPVSSWDMAPPSVATPAPTYEVRRVQVTLDQLERLATAASIEVELVTADGTRSSFAAWRGTWADWLPFVAGIDTEAQAGLD
jgi:hypothetical protein